MFNLLLHILEWFASHLAWDWGKRFIGKLLPSVRYKPIKNELIRYIKQDIKRGDISKSHISYIQFFRNLLELARFVNGKYDPYIKANIMLYNQEKNTLEMICSTNYKPIDEFIHNYYWADTKKACYKEGAKKGKCSDCFTTGQMIIIENTSKGQMHLTEFQHSVLFSLICFPLRNNEEKIVGVINVDSPNKYAFTKHRYEQYQMVLKEINNLLLMAIKNDFIDNYKNFSSRLLIK